MCFLVFLFFIFVFCLLVLVERLRHRLINAVFRRQIDARPRRHLAIRVAIPHIVREVARVEFALVLPGMRVAIVRARPRLHGRLRRFRLHECFHGRLDDRFLRFRGFFLDDLDLHRRRFRRLHDRRFRDLRRFQRRLLGRRTGLLGLRRLRLHRLLRLEFGRRRLFGRLLRLFGEFRRRFLGLLFRFLGLRFRLFFRFRRDLLRHGRADDRHGLRGRHRVRV